MKRARTSQTAAEKNAKAVVRARSGGVCEGCDKARAFDWAHRISRAQGGPWQPANGVDLCRKCHDWAHDNPTLARDGFGWSVRREHDYLTTPVWLFRHGWCLLDNSGGVHQVELGETA